ncbi:MULTISPECIES: amidohydrolase [Synechococcales]|uniref:amidohydrolase n=1 Tax=Synechococcus sp. CS-1325 TaxID=2847979 RepID=UPI00223C405A|nr:amidohydrolase [Synechococcus sp. CS-1325]
MRNFKTALIVSTLLAGQAMAAPGPGPDLIIDGGPILTMEGAEPAYVETVAVEKGRIVYAGNRAGAMKLKGTSTRLKSLGGKTMMPGFIDSHQHFMQLGAQAVGANLLPSPDGKADTIDTLVDELKVFAKSPDVAQTGWIYGMGYDDSVLGRHPTKADLDRVSTTVPVAIIHISGHFSVMNSAGLVKAGITAASKDPVGGTIGRMPGSSEPDGYLAETAHFVAALPAITPISPAGKDYFVKRALELAKSFGQTTVNEGRVFDAATAKSMESLAERGMFDIDVIGFADYLDTSELPVWGQKYRSRLRFAGSKITLDGSPQGRTAWRTTPYLIPPDGLPANYKGIPSIPDTAIVTAAIAKAYDNKWLVKIHANGDAAIDQLLDAVGQVTATRGVKQGQVILIHGQFLRPDQIPRLKALGIFPSMFPMHTFYWGDWYTKIVGPDKAAQISPMRSILNAGMIASSHTDAPVALPDLMQVSWATVNRTSRSGKVMGSNERVTAFEAMKMITIWSADQFREGDQKGSIKVGKLADLVVLSANPVAIDPKLINTIKVMETIKDGRTVWIRKP